MDQPQVEWLQALADLENPHHAEFFADHSGLRDVRSVELIHDEVLRVLYADSNRAERLANAAGWLAQELDEAAAQAWAVRARGHVSYGRSRYEEAVAAYAEALSTFSTLGRERDAGRTLISGIQPLIYLGRYDEAYQWASRAREIFQRLGDELRLARVTSNLGNLLYRQDRYAEAQAMYQEAHATLGRLGESRDVAAVLSNMAVCSISLGRFSEALETYGQAREYCNRHGLTLLVAGADYNIAYLHYLQGDFLRAIELYEKSREHCRTVGDAYHAALCDLDEAELYLDLNLNAEAARLADQAETGFVALSMPYERSKAIVTHAIAASRRGQALQAGRLFRKARRLFAGEHNALWPALIDLYCAVLLAHENRSKEAAALCRRAWPVLSESALPAPAILLELLQVRLLLETNQRAPAREALAAAEHRLESYSTPALRLHAFVVRGELEERCGDTTAALSAYESARAEIETLRSRLWGDEPKISFLKDKLSVYESLVSLRLSGAPVVSRPSAVPDAAAAAFSYIQEAKSRTLADLLARPGTATPGDLPAPKQLEIEEARNSLNTWYRHLERIALSSDAAGGTQIEAIRKQIRECERRLTQLVAHGWPDPAGAVSETPLGLEAVQAAIPEDALLLEYYVVKGVLCVALLGRSSLEIVSLHKVEAMRTQLRLLQFQMRKFQRAATIAASHGQWAGDATETHLRDLYDSLIHPIRHRLDGARHLIIAAHDFLHHLAFHALRGPGGHLIDEFTVSYAPSATVFALCRGRDTHPGVQSLILGLPDQRAPHIQIETERAAASLQQARLFVGEAATEKVLRTLGPHSRYIHIATHGLFRRDHPLFSAMRLGDSHLTLLDLYRLKLSAELVVLSGCSTGLNVVVGGDELLGLSRGLLQAGARGVMVSLWDVNDLSTARFMESFYRYLPAAPHKAAAIQAAIQELRAEYPHPYYWAPFTLAGDYV